MEAWGLFNVHNLAHCLYKTVGDYTETVNPITNKSGGR
jgi:hypothetical protein